MRLRYLAVPRLTKGVVLATCSCRQACPGSMIFPQARLTFFSRALDHEKIGSARRYWRKFVGKHFRQHEGLKLKECRYRDGRDECSWKIHRTLPLMPALFGGHQAEHCPARIEHKMRPEKTEGYCHCPQRRPPTWQWHAKNIRFKEFPVCRV